MGRSGIDGPAYFSDAIFLSSNLLKVVEGAWAPLALGATIVLLVLTWRRGTFLLLRKTRQDEVPLDTLIVSLEKKPPHIVPGTAVFLTSDPSSAPTALLHNLKHNKVLHDHNVILTIRTENTPRLSDEDRVSIRQVTRLFAKVEITFGFMETPNIPKALAIRSQAGLEVRHHVHIVLSFAARAQARHALRNAALARPSIYRTSKIRERCV
jgi:KUP system potassium uptake protein